MSYIYDDENIHWRGRTWRVTHRQWREAKPWLFTLESIVHRGPKSTIKLRETKLNNLLKQGKARITLCPIPRWDNIQVEDAPGRFHVFAAYNGGTLEVIGPGTGATFFWKGETPAERIRKGRRRPVGC